MASLKFTEKLLLEEFLEMSDGYVLNFSNRTFSAFFADFDVDIDGAQYSKNNSGSKANRMRSFWDISSDRQVGEVILKLVEYAESYRPDHPKADDCRAISTRLLDSQHPATQPSATSANLRQENLIPRRTNGPTEIFFSYAHEDEELIDEIRLQLVIRERMGEIVKWHDRKIPAGDEWRDEIDSRIRRANVILLFMSPHFLASRYCYETEGTVALNRHRDGTARVIPVILRACDWTATPFGDLQGLPKDGVPFTQWPDRDQASLDIARGIMESVS